MIFLIILGIIIAVLLVILFVPVRADMAYFDDFDFKISFLGIPVYKTRDRKKQFKKEVSKEEKQEEKKTDNYFVRLKKKQGFTTAVKLLMGFAGDVLKAIKRLLKHITINKVRLNITVGSFDAAVTAIEYGAVCDVVYPVTAALSGQNIGFKEISVNADFENGKNEFGFSLAASLQIFYLLTAAVKILILWKKFVSENIEDERK